MTITISIAAAEQSQWLTHAITVAGVLLGGVMTYVVTRMLSRRELRTLNQARARRLLMKLKRISDVSRGINGHAREALAAAEEIGASGQWESLQPMIGIPKVAVSFDADDIAFLGPDQSEFLNDLLLLESEYSVLIELVVIYNEDRVNFIPDKIDLSQDGIGISTIDLTNPKQAIHLHKLETLAAQLINTAERLEIRSRQVVDKSTDAIRSALKTKKVPSLSIAEEPPPEE